MRAVVIYESMFGNTHVIADHVAEGLGEEFEVTEVGVADLSAEMLAGVDLLVVGGPTHVHGMSSKRSREAAVEQAGRDEEVTLDPEAPGPGLKDWIGGLDEGHDRLAAAFDTRVDASPVLTGGPRKASPGASKTVATNWSSSRRASSSTSTTTCCPAKQSGRRHGAPASSLVVPDDG